MDPVSPIASSSQASTSAASIKTVIESAIVPDVVIKGRECPKELVNLGEIRRRAAEKISHAVNDGYYKYMPIDRRAMIKGTVFRTITRDSICTALGVPAVKNGEDADELREHYRNSSLYAGEGKRRGFVVSDVRPIVSCHNAPVSYRWSESKIYEGVANCQDVVDAIGEKKLPTVLFAVDAPREKVQSDYRKKEVAPLFKKFIDSGPVDCASPLPPEGPFEFDDTYSEIDALSVMPVLEMAMRCANGDGWASCTQVRSCTTRDGVEHRPSGMLFNFSIHVYVDINASVDGNIGKYTLVIGQIAAVSKHKALVAPFSSYIVGRFNGSEFAKKLIYEKKKNEATR